MCLTLSCARTPVFYVQKMSRRSASTSSCRAGCEPLREMFWTCCTAWMWRTPLRCASRCCNTSSMTRPWPTSSPTSVSWMTSEMWILQIIGNARFDCKCSYFLSLGKSGKWSAKLLAQRDFELAHTNIISWRIFAVRAITGFGSWMVKSVIWRKVNMHCFTGSAIKSLEWMNLSDWLSPQFFFFFFF